MDQQPHTPSPHRRVHSRSTPMLPLQATDMDRSDERLSAAEQRYEAVFGPIERRRGHPQMDGASLSHSRAHSNSNPGSPPIQRSSVGSGNTIIAQEQGTPRTRPAGGHTYSDGTIYTHNRGPSDSSRAQTWHDFLRESGGDAAEGPYPPFLDQHRRRASRLSHVESSEAPTMHSTPPQAQTDRRRRSTAPEPPSNDEPEFRTGAYHPVVYPRQTPQIPRPRIPRPRQGHAYSTSVSDIASANYNLDRTSRQPPLPPLPPHAQGPSRAISHPQRSDYFRSEPDRDNNIVLPPWQPDAEVTQCPVCSSNFTFFTRKHHCRKCGRVVCARCSPHRITIPRQFIVKPPLDELGAGSPHGSASAGQPDVDAVPEAFYTQVLNPALGGGEEVRVCNPCVPDPNFSPPPRRPEAHSTQSQPLQNTGSQVQTDRSSEGHSSLPVRRELPIYDGENAYSAYLDNMIGDVLESRQRLRDAGEPPPPPPRWLTEDDLCPVCGQEYFVPEVRSDMSKERHVAACIEARIERMRRPVRDPNRNDDSDNGSDESEDAIRDPPGVYSRFGGRSEDQLRQKLVYKATEKDCTGEIGDECCICLMGYEAGEDLARLACLCKFHNTCIDGWWEIKGPGACPTHQINR